MTEIDPKVCECCGNDEATTSVCTDCLADPCSHGLPRSPTWCDDCGARLDVKSLCPSCLPNSERMPDEVVDMVSACGCRS